MPLKKTQKPAGALELKHEKTNTHTVVVGIAAVLGAWALHDPVYVAVLVGGSESALCIT